MCERDKALKQVQQALQFKISVMKKQQRLGNAKDGAWRILEGTHGSAVWR
jgi:hypothetical protein